MLRALILTPLIANCAANAQEFEIEIIDYYDPLATSDKEAIEYFIKTHNIEGEYYKEKTGIGWNEGGSGGGGCGRDVWFCVDFRLPGPTYKDKSYLGYQNASNVSYEGKKIRFELPWSDKYGDLRKIRAYGVDIKLYPESNRRFPQYIESYDMSPNTEMHGGSVFRLIVRKPIIFKLSLVENGKVVTGDKAPNMALKDDSKSLHKAIYVRYAPSFNKASDIINPLPILTGDKIKGERFIMGALEVTGMKDEYLRRDETLKISAEIIEHRYVKDGKLFKIKGDISIDAHANSRRVYDIKQYAVHFYENGSRKVYFHWGGNQPYERGELKNGDLAPIIEIENDLSKMANELAKMPTKYSKDDLKEAQKAISYVKHVLSASEEELKKEFDIYKKELPPIQHEANK
jgi:hypothetical protein